MKPFKLLPNITPTPFTPPPDFDKIVEGWERKAGEHRGLALTSEKRLRDLATGIESYGAKIPISQGRARKLEAAGQPVPRLQVGALWEALPSWARNILGFGSLVELPEQARREMRQEVTTTELELERNDFYARLYGQAPIAISGGSVTNPDQILELLKPPPNMTPDELDEIHNTIGTMVDTLMGTGEALPEMALESEPPELPELVAPTDIFVTPTSIHTLTVESIINSLTTPRVPPSVMSEDEWADFMVESGQISDKADLESVEFMKSQSEAIIAEWQERNNMIEAFRTGVAEMPDYEVVDLLKELVVMPGMGLLELAGMYFEHVSMPLAGLVYKTFIPDIDAAYQRYRKTDSTWQALSHAWMEWDAPGEGAGEWILKYMLMEGLTDPLMYVGWGIATRITRPLGSFGRVVGATERGIASLFELPFNMIKAGIKKLPKTTAQQANIAMAKTGQYVDKFMTQRFGKAVWQMSVKEWDEGVQAAVKYTLGHPQIDNITTRVGKELLKHSPTTEKEVLEWSRRLGTTLSPEDITKHTVDSVDRVFEDFFSTVGAKKKLITNSEAADELVRVLFGELSAEKSIVASKLLLNKSSMVINAGRSFGTTRTTFHALRQLMRRNRSIFIKAESSSVALAMKEMGQITTLLTKIPIRVEKVWARSIDKWVVRPFAESYLTFALYGPMNVIEDIIRTVLGGVGPGARSAKAFARRHAGTTYDTMLVTEESISETLGAIAAKGPGERTNWVIQMAFLGNKGMADRTFDVLVRKPGQIGMAIRRHFIDAKYTQVMKEIGGEPLEMLTKVGPDKLMGVTNKGIIRDVQQVAMELKMQGLPDALRATAGDFTRAKVVRKEVQHIMNEHPDMPIAVRDFVMRQYDDGLMFKEGAQGIQNTTREAGVILTDDFIQSAEYAHRGFEQLAEELTQLEVRNPQEMAQLIQSLNLMSSVYGATPKQILGKAVERTRGLPFAERRLSMDMALDNITVFRERAGASMDKVMERIRVQMSTVFPDNPQYISKADQLFNLQTSKRLRSSELGEEINAWRHTWFAEADPAALKTNAFWDDFAVEVNGRWHGYNVEMADFDGMIKNAIDDLDIAGGIPARQRAAIKVTDRELSPHDVGQLIGARGDDISRGLLDVLTAQNDRDMFTAYVMAHVKQADAGFTKESVGAVYDQIVNSLHIPPERMSWIAGRQLELKAMGDDLHTLYNTKLLPDEEVAAIGRYFNETADAVQDIMYSPARGKQLPKLKEQFTNYQNLRQQAMDESHKWYYKEFTDYSNANAFDSVLKAIYPFWTYESQRWFWLPRSFIRHPGTFTSYERWQDNTNYGYIHIPGTSVDINPFRGTIYGTLSTRLARRDFPEYYDSLGAAGDIIEFNDFLTRYGFYPGAHIGMPLAVFGGVEMQFGETMPSLIKTPLDAMIAMFPDNEAVSWISDRVFGDRFRNYMTMLIVTRMGGNGSLIFSKKQEGEELTDEEEQVWSDARREVGWYSAGFEQFGLFRMRTDEQYKMYEEAGKVIEEMTGFTPDQQSWLRKHGHRLWDIVGGMSPTEQAVLEELDYYKWVGNVRPLLPGKQQEILNKIELGWDDVTRYTETVQDSKLQLQRDFLLGARGPDDYNVQLLDLYDKQREFIDNKIEEYPLMALENRTEYYKKYGQPQPVLHPMRELLNLFFSIELKEVTNPETGEVERDWDNFWAQRQAVEDSIPDEYKPEWEEFLAKNSTRVEELRREVYHNYFRTYNKVWEKILSTYPDNEQDMINEYLSLERRGTDLTRQAAIKATPSEKTGRALISSFRSEVSDAKQALRYHNPQLDAWLYYWGRTSTFASPTGEEVYYELAKQTGRRIQ